MVQPWSTLAAIQADRAMLKPLVATQNAWQLTRAESKALDEDDNKTPAVIHHPLLLSTCR